MNTKRYCFKKIVYGACLLWRVERAFAEGEAAPANPWPWIFVILLTLAAAAFAYLRYRGKGASPRVHTGEHGPATEIEEDFSSGECFSEYDVGYAQTIGARANQEDSYCVSDWKSAEVVNRRGLLALVADGIGGIDNGELASSTVARSMSAHFAKQNPERPASDRLLELMAQAQHEVLALQSHGKKCGTTLGSVLIYRRNLFFLAVGDSRIALFRAGMLLPLNREHVLGREIDETAALSEGGDEPDHRKRYALTSLYNKVTF